MSDIQYHKARLEESFESLVNADPDDGLVQRASLRGIMQGCHALRLDLRDYLRGKFVAQHTAASEVGRKPHAFRCRDCGDTFPTPQARNGHMAHCKQKGGVSHA